MFRFDSDLMCNLSLKIRYEEENINELIFKLKTLRFEMMDDAQFLLFDQSNEIVEKLDKSITLLEENSNRLESLREKILYAVKNFEEIDDKQKSSIAELVQYMSGISYSVSNATNISYSSILNYAHLKGSKNADVTITDISQIKNNVDKNYEVIGIDTIDS